MTIEAAADRAGERIAHPWWADRSYRTPPGRSVKRIGDRNRPARAVRELRADLAERIGHAREFFRHRAQACRVRERVYYDQEIAVAERLGVH
ncbi:MAG: hypothetical protein DMF94_16460 [Acidobacteria bacterium]|nr:MAG: hypothetical protein DMF94_16460 [Acidobacteriota bacterium]